MTLEHELLANKLALNLIASIMGWHDENIATREYAWLRLMSAVKFDGYSDFRAGTRFIESLATWLKQFDPIHRQAAYNFVKQRLVYISPAELQRVIEVFLPETVTPYMRKVVAKKLGIKPYQVWGNPEGRSEFARLLRCSLFVGLSDGSRVDVLRRANAGRISTEQVVPMMNIGNEKWEDLGAKLKREQGDDARFEHVYLIDDFTASGTTFVRYLDDRWKGKLSKFNDLIRSARKALGAEFPVANCYMLHIHHYISTFQARQTLERRVARAINEWSERDFRSVVITEGVLLPENMKMEQATDAEMLALCEHYYDHQLYERLKRHCDEAGQTDMKLGYANCALPICLYHNTPNNSISLLWAETSGQNGHPMQPLFRRRDRHG